MVDTGNRRIRRIALDTHVVSTVAGAGEGGFADGQAGSALLMPWGGIAAFGNDVFVGDTGNLEIRLLRNGAVKSYAGSGRSGSLDGTGAAASFDLPMGVASLADGSLAVADEGASIIRLVR